MSLFSSRPSADLAAERMKIYAQPQRLMILSRLIDGERTVSEIDDATKIGQPALSQQLAELRRANVVRTRRESKQVFYRLADERVADCVRSIEALFGDMAPVRVIERPTGERPPKKSPPRPKGAASFARVITSNE
jgi:DNA-binding transcriptional ArsR family regulator